MEHCDVPTLYGLVLAGGDSQRMGRDKAQLRYHCDETQLRHAVELLGAVTRAVYVSVRASQAQSGLYAQVPLIVDDTELRGPAAGLLAAWGRHPEAAWLVLATDLPFVDAAVLTRLQAARDVSKLATAFRHSDGTPEPLCTIWEPAARTALLARVAVGDSSLRRLLDGEAATLLDAADPRVLRSVDSADQYEAARAEIAARTGVPRPVR